VIDASRLHVTFAEGTAPDGPLTPRRYTLTHSDRTGHLFLTVGLGYDARALRAPQVRLERDEVLGEWVVDEGGPLLELHMAAQGGLPIFGTARMRVGIFRHYRGLVLDALRTADAGLSASHRGLGDAPVVARFHWRRGRVESEDWGRWGEC
jgi:hypothetical protein